MRLTSRTEYALLALVYLGRNIERPISVSEIAKEQGIPVKFLEQIFAVLRDEEYVKSTKGRTGGYLLLRAPEKISLAEIVRLFDGALAPSGSVSKFYYKSTPLEKEQKLKGVMKKVRAAVVEIMEGTTLNDVI